MLARSVFSGSIYSIIFDLAMSSCTSPHGYQTISSDCAKRNPWPLFGSCIGVTDEIGAKVMHYPPIFQA